MLVILHYLMSLGLKFHKDPSFCFRDIHKTILTFKDHQFSMYFAYFHTFAPPMSSKMDDFYNNGYFLETR